MMTIQNRFTADVSDILHVQLECPCGAIISFMPDKAVYPHECPQCRAEWKDHFQSTQDQQSIEMFLSALKLIRAQQSINKRMRVRLEYDATQAVRQV